MRFCPESTFREEVHQRDHGPHRRAMRDLDDNACLGVAPTRPSLGQARQPQAVCETGAMLRPPDRYPAIKLGNTKRGIELAQMVRCISRLLHSPGKRMACGDDDHHEREARQLLEGLSGPGEGQIETSGKQMRQGHAGLHPEHLGIQWAETHRTGKEPIGLGSPRSA